MRLKNPWDQDGQINLREYESSKNNESKMDTSTSAELKWKPA